MNKLDVLMVLLGIASYLAIVIDLRNTERKSIEFDSHQEKRRIYQLNMNKRRREEIARAKLMERKAQEKMELRNIAGTVEKLGTSDI